MSTFEIWSIGLSILAMIISIYVFFDNLILAKRGFNRNFRPYLFAVNYGYKDETTHLLKADTKHLLVVVVNAPAFITSQKITFYARDKNNNDEYITHIENKNITIYPTERTQHTMGAELKITNDEMLDKIKDGQLIRKIHIQYTWIDKHDSSYFFKSEFKYITEIKYWQPISDEAN